ncbi:hypothetical protein AMJ52_03675 [candidate division TA06 bacterium DG_78]|uniref:L,D-TPase catalytic domain-containing protein n=1 Tax=candidate division TA06 bacterium DG_78 TaxID=1703772 RepID=A0A0S7YFN4_UNCT6|nr:MAG: hypothetical protein AMJ52_03675 [candidate division TA06 bacterium DG_78]
MLIVITTAVNLFYTPSILFAQGLSDRVQEFLRSRIESVSGLPKISVGEELIYASVVLPVFYERRGFWPVWSNDDGLLPNVDVMVKAIRTAEHEGFNPNDYHILRIDAMVGEIRQNQKNKIPFDPRRFADLDLLLTDAFLIYGAHLLAGKVDPEKIDAEWNASRREVDLAEVLENAHTKNRILDALQNLLPPQPGYTRLKEALARYRKIAASGGWSVVPAGPKLQKDDKNERVSILRNRLIATGDLVSLKGDSADLFDDELEQAVRRFQQRHGLDVDGVVGPATLGALNVSVDERIEQIILNMERWRWLPHDLGRRYVIINISNFELDVVENGKTVMTMKAVVGKPFRRTPVFSDKMTYLVLSPYWNVPNNIAVQDILPIIRKNPGYLTSKKIKVFKGWGVEAQEISPAAVDWTTITAKNFNYRFRQDPGSQNALGRVKFMFPNKYNVYIHDTPSKELFAKAERGFSSGCIRIEDPIDLAEYVLRGDPKWTREKILIEINKGIEQTIKLPEQIPVHLLYWTAWADENGLVQFRNDVYERDKLLEEAFFEKPPKATN